MSYEVSYSAHVVVVVVVVRQTKLSMVSVYDWLDQKILARKTKENLKLFIG